MSMSTPPRTKAARCAANSCRSHRARPGMGQPAASALSGLMRTRSRPVSNGRLRCASRLARRGIDNALRDIPLRYIDRRVLLDDLRDPRLPGIVSLHGEERRAAAHRGDIDVGILGEDPEIAIGAAAVAPVAGN